MRSPLLGLTCSQPQCKGLQLAISGDSTMSGEEFYGNCILICLLQQLWKMPLLLWEYCVTNIWSRRPCLLAS